jgi:predicted 2-oxoglutarate/Fe(II)-dependent dioxygenase YbiX
MGNCSWQSASHAPVVVVPEIFDPELCHDLIEADGDEGRSLISFNDQNFRRRADKYIRNQGILDRINKAIATRLLPVIWTAFQFRATQIERYLVGCYDAETGGFFKPHTDNALPQVAHRRFALTINLNDGYEGGHLRFPEFDQSFNTMQGYGVVFSCSLIHEVIPITKGRRLAFLSFLHDGASQKLTVG